MLIRPVRILNIRDLKKPVRVRAANPQNRAAAFAVLHLALEAHGLDLALLLGGFAVGECVSRCSIMYVEFWGEKRKGGELTRCRWSCRSSASFGLRRPCR